MRAGSGPPDEPAALHRQTSEPDFQLVDMKKLLPLICMLFSLGAAVRMYAQSGNAPTTQKEKLSYALGMNFAQTMKTRGIEIDPAMFSAAMKDVMNGNKVQMTDAQTRETFEAVDKDLQAKQQASAKPMAEKNKAFGSAYLIANKAKPGIQTLPDGLQYKVLTEGSGPSPKTTDTVTVKYKGTLADGTEFDNSDKQPGGTVSFPVNGRDPRLDRGAAKNESRLQMAALHSVRPRLRRRGSAAGHSARLDAALRRGIGEDRRIMV